jgi:N-acetylglucosamine-6-phosphate deacetylase
LADTGIIRARRLYDGQGGEPLDERAVVVREGRIAAVCPLAEAPEGDVLAEADIVVPGLVDLQINGAGGVLFNDQPDVAGLQAMAAGARKGGTAWFLPTYITDFDQRYGRAISAVADAIGQVPGVVGVHLEGPFLSPLRPGIHPADAIRAMTDADIALIGKTGVPLLLTLAPEQTTAGDIARLTAAGVTVFAGHSEAGFDDMTGAEAAGLRGVTHLFNAMSQMQGREPGVVGAVFASDRLFAGIIADGVHVHPANLGTALRVLGPDRLFLVTDAMSPLGTELAEFTLMGKRITRQGGILSGETGTLAGADISMIEAVTRTVELSGCSLADAIRMATLTPARAIGLEHEIGSIAPGKRAGLTLLSEGLEVQGVVVDGRVV